jgi:hypothetical protein
MSWAVAVFVSFASIALGCWGGYFATQAVRTTLASALADTSREEPAWVQVRGVVSRVEADGSRFELAARNPYDATGAPLQLALRMPANIPIGTADPLWGSLDAGAGAATSSSGRRFSALQPGMQISVLLKRTPGELEITYIMVQT